MSPNLGVRFGSLLRRIVHAVRMDGIVVLDCVIEGAQARISELESDCENFGHKPNSRGNWNDHGGSPLSCATIRQSLGAAHRLRCVGSCGSTVDTGQDCRDRYWRKPRASSLHV